LPYTVLIHVLLFWDIHVLHCEVDEDMPALKERKGWFFVWKRRYLGFFFWERE